jgi:beta-exotoxin I transport system permease protein
VRLSVLRRSLRDSRRAIGWWSVGLVGLVAMIVAVYPAIHHNRSLTKLARDYPKALKAFIGFGGAVDYTTAAGYLGTELFSFMVPLLLLVVGIGAGARAIAGDERAGTFDLLLANPISRRRVVLERLGAVAAEVLALALVLWASLAIGTALAGMDITGGRLAAASVEGALLALVFGALALLVGCATGSTTTSVAVPAAAAVAAYLVNALAALVHALEPARKASPFYLYTSGDPLRRGLPFAQTALLVLLAGVFGVLSPPALERRDLT